MEELNKDTLNKLNENQFSILMIYHENCNHCKEIKPQIEELSKSIFDIKFFKANVMDIPEHYNEINAESIPYFAVYHQAKSDDKYGFIGGDTGSNIGIVHDIINMIRHFKDQQMEIM